MTASGCSHHSFQQQLKNVPSEKLELNKRNNTLNKIAFLTFSITLKDSTKDLYEIRLINTIFAEGALKKADFAEKTVIEPNYLYYQILGENGAKKGDHYERIENPLSQVYEYPSGNGTLAKKTITKSFGELVIRFQYDQTTKSILIFKPDPLSLVLKPIYHATF